MASALYLPRYDQSHALVIGIDKYQAASPLLHASNDAIDVAQILITQFGFPPENVKLLTDQAATRKAILQEYLSFSSSTASDDRLLIFFAGHGHTVTGRRGETGFLVPVDGDPRDLASLIRWDNSPGMQTLYLQNTSCF